MWMSLEHAAAMLWDWFPAITTLARGVTALLGLAMAGHRAVRWWQTLRGTRNRTRLEPAGREAESAAPHEHPATKSPEGPGSGRRR